MIVFCAQRTYVVQPVDTTCEGFYSMEHSNSVPAETAESDALPHPNVSVHDYIPLFPCTDPKKTADEMTVVSALPGNILEMYGHVLCTL